MLNNLLLFSLLFITLTAPTAFSQEKGADVLTVNPAFAEIDKGTRVKRETTTIAEGDHSLISRFPGAKNFKSSRLDFDAVEFPSSDTESFASPK